MVTTMTISDYGQVYRPLDSTGPVFPLNFATICDRILENLPSTHKRHLK